MTSNPYFPAKTAPPPSKLVEIRNRRLGCDNGAAGSDRPFTPRPASSSCQPLSANASEDLLACHWSAEGEAKRKGPSRLAGVRTSAPPASEVGALPARTSRDRSYQRVCPSLPLRVKDGAHRRHVACGSIASPASPPFLRARPRTPAMRQTKNLTPGLADADKMSFDVSTSSR